MNPFIFDYDNAFDACDGLYWYCAHFHGGQASKEYRILSLLKSELKYKPGLITDGPSESAQVFYNYLEESRDVETFYTDLKTFIQGDENV